MSIKKQSSFKKQKRNRVIAIFVLIIILLSISFTRKIIRNSIVVVFMPVVWLEHNITSDIYNFFETFRTKSSLLSENQNLHNEIDSLKAHYANYDELFLENQNLKSILGRSDGKNFILATVLSRPPVSLYDTLLVDGGLSVGISQGQIVYFNGDIPIGYISQVFSRSAIVELYSSSSEKMDARLEPENFDVTLFGHGGGDYTVSVPHDLSIASDTVVISEEINPHIFGTLQNVISDPRDSLQNLIFSSPVNLNQIDVVEIAK